MPKVTNAYSLMEEHAMKFEKNTVQRYIGNILRYKGISKNIMFSIILLYCIFQISLHVPPPMNVANVSYYIACLATVFHFWIPKAFVSVLQATNTGPWYKTTHYKMELLFSQKVLMSFHLYE